MVTGKVFSVYMNNISGDVVSYQKACVDKFLPTGWVFSQRLVNKRHPEALQDCVNEVESGIVVFLDIDCIPLSERGFKYLAERASLGALCGAIQRANHINNNCHLYVGPFCMAFSIRDYRKNSSPSFNESSRGDVGEELTYSWERHNQSIQFLYPSNVVEPKWNLGGNIKFGFGTTYQGMFFHSFCIRCAEQEQMFTSKCKQVLTTN